MTTATRDWSGIKESLRRERHVHDLLARSGSARLHQRVISAPDVRTVWQRSERILVELERTIRLLDVGAADFWTRYRDLQDRLIRLYHDAGVTFRG